MKVEHRDGSTVSLIPRTDDALKVAVQAAPDGGLAVAIDVDTETLGRFTIPLTASQLGAIAATCNWLLKLDAGQVDRLRGQLLNTETPNEETNP